MESLSILLQLGPQPSHCVSVRIWKHTLKQILGSCSYTVVFDVDGGFGSIGVQDEVRITLACSQSDFIAYDKMVISLKGGEM